MELIKNLFRKSFLTIIIMFMVLVYIVPPSIIVYKLYIKDKATYTVDVTYLNGTTERKTYELPEDSTIHKIKLDGVYIIEYEFGLLESDVDTFKIIDIKKNN